jgi:serine/threonine protein kinase
MHVPRRWSVPFDTCKVAHVVDGRPESGVLGVARDLFAGKIAMPSVDEQQAFRDATTDVNRRRLRVILPIMAVVHLVHVAVFYAPVADPLVARWRQGLVLTHAGTALAVLPLVLLAWRRGSRFMFVLGPAAAFVYLMHAAAITAVDQLVVKNVAVFMAYAFGMAVVFAGRPLQSVAIYAAGWVAVAVALFTQQPDEALRTAQLVSASSSCIVGVVLQTLLASARRRDFTQRRTIDKQRAELAAVNAGLEKRVHDQVGEIVKRAAEVSTLNAQLQAQVRARSNELTLALSRLAFRRDLDGKLPAGTVLGDRFEVRAPLGEGGMGTVYEGLDRETKASVAIKVIQATSARHLDAMKRFLAEAATVSTVTHPAVVKMIHVDISEDGLLYQVQELIDGTTLGVLMDAGKSFIGTEMPVVAGRSARIGAVLAEALAAAHAQGIVHRDVKPDNIMLTSNAPGLKLLDFGIAKLADEGTDWETKTGVVIGTPSFMAPEQVEGSSSVTDRADVYALGVIVFRLVSDRLPFLGATGKVRMMKRLEEDAPPLRDVAPTAPEDLAELVAHCLKRQPEQRPSARELADAFARCADRLNAPPLGEMRLERTPRVTDSAREKTSNERRDATVSMAPRKGSSEGG